MGGGRVGHRTSTISTATISIMAAWAFSAAPGSSAGTAGGRPIAIRPVPPGTPRWGREWKQAAAKWYDHAFNIGASGCQLRAPRKLSGPRSDLPRCAGPAAGADDLQFPRKRLQALGIYRRRARADRAGHEPDHDRCTAQCGAAITTWCRINRPTIPAAPSRATTPRPAWSTAICRPGKPIIFSSWGRRCSRRMLRTTRPALVGALAYYAAEAITTRYIKNPGPLVHA